MRKVTLARGGALSPYSGLGSTHSALADRLKSGLVEGYELGNIHEYEINLEEVVQRTFESGKNITERRYCSHH